MSSYFVVYYISIVKHVVLPQSKQSDVTLFIFRKSIYAQLHYLCKQ